MLRFKQDSDYVISAKHYLHAAHSLVSLMIDEVSECRDFVKNSPLQANDYREKIVNNLDKCLEVANKNAADISRATRAEFKQHAQTLKAHRKFMTRWEAKIGSAMMSFIRTSANLHNNFAAPAREVLEGGEKEIDGNTITEADAKAMTQSDESRKQSLELIDKLIETAVGLHGIPSQLDSYDDFIEASSIKRHERLQELTDDDSPSFSKLVSVLRLGEYGSLKAVKQLVELYVRNTVNQKLTPEAVNDNPKLLQHDELYATVREAVSLAYHEVLAAVTGSVRDRLEDSEDGMSIAEFNKEVVTKAVRKAFSFADARSSAIRNVSDIVNSYADEELNVKINFDFSAEAQ